MGGLMESFAKKTVKQPWRNSPYAEIGKVDEVPISWLDRFKEHDRRLTPKYGPQDTTLNELIKDISENGIKEPLPITIGIQDGTALLSEGNTRLAAAKALGYTHVPVRVVRYNNARGVPVEMPGIDELVSKRKHINADLSPSEVFDPNILKGLMAPTAVGASLYSPEAAQARQMQDMASQQALQEPTFDPTTLLAGPARWGGGLMNAGIDTAMKYFMGGK